MPNTNLQDYLFSFHTQYNPVSHYTYNSYNDASNSIKWPISPLIHFQLRCAMNVLTCQFWYPKTWANLLCAHYYSNKSRKPCLQSVLRYHLQQILLMLSINLTSLYTQPTLLFPIHTHRKFAQLNLILFYTITFPHIYKLYIFVCYNFSYYHPYHPNPMFWFVTRPLSATW